MPGVGRKQRGQLMPVLGVGEIDARVLQAGEKAVDGLIVEGVGGDESAQFAAHFVAVAGVVEAGAGRGDDAGLGGELAVTVAQIERGQEFADGEIAGSAEYDEIARCHGGRGRHESLLTYVGGVESERVGEFWRSASRLRYFDEQNR